MSKSTPRRGKAAAKPAARRTTRTRTRSGAAAPASAPSPARSDRLPRAAKGKRATFYADPAIDSLLAVIAALTAEVSVAFDRISTLERLLEQRELLPGDAIESYEPDEAESRHRGEAREALIERVFRVLALQGADAPPVSGRD